MEKNKIGICGLGMVGGTLRKWFEKQSCELFLYDKFKKIGSPELLNEADFIFIAVPTPTTEVGCDINAVNEVFGGLKGEKVVIIKSTIIPGTTDKLQIKYPQHKILFNPEFLTAETSEKDMEHPDRQIVGYTESSRGSAWEVMGQLPDAPLKRIMPVYIAEFVKYAANTFLAMKVAKNNELYDVFKKFGGTDSDFEILAEGLGADTRIGNSHLKIWHNGKRGFGNFENSKCLPKDLIAFIKFAKMIGVEVKLSEAVRDINNDLLKMQGLRECPK